MESSIKAESSRQSQILNSFETLKRNTPVQTPMYRQCNIRSGRDKHTGESSGVGAHSNPPVHRFPRVRSK
jgi:hypothetical protein